MSTSKDYYHILGVTPSADIAVIKAVYKALALKFHPDRNKDNPDHAAKRMSEINEAYSVLCDEKTRAAYDSARNKSEEAPFEENEETLKSAEDLLAELIEEDWAVAEKYHPDVKVYVEKLSRISRSLVLPFKIYVLNEQLFSTAEKIGNLMVENYIRSYFGKDENILQYAYELLVDGDREAARELNRAIRVLGKDVQPQKLMHSIDKEYQTKHFERQKKALKEQREKNAKGNETNYGCLSNTLYTLFIGILVFVLIAALLSKL